MRLHRTTAIIAMWAVLFGAGRGAQAQAGLREGLKVRVSLPAGPRVTGVIQSITPDSIILFGDPAATRVGVARSAIQAIDVSHGRSAAAGAKKGALWGAATFGGMGTVLAIAAAGESGSTRDELGVNPAVFALVTIAEGAGIGAIIGALVKSERWQSVPVAPTVGMGANGVRVGVRVR